MRDLLSKVRKKDRPKDVFTVFTYITGCWLRGAGEAFFKIDLKFVRSSPLSQRSYLFVPPPIARGNWVHLIPLGHMVHNVCDRTMRDRLLLTAQPARLWFGMTFKKHNNCHNGQFVSWRMVRVFDAVKLNFGNFSFVCKIIK